MSTTMCLIPGWPPPSSARTARGRPPTPTVAAAAPRATIDNHSRRPVVFPMLSELLWTRILVRSATRTTRQGFDRSAAARSILRRAPAPYQVKPPFTGMVDNPGGDYPGPLMTREEQVKEVGRRAGARVVGIASVEAFRAKVPEGYRPENILPGARR